MRRKFLTAGVLGVTVLALAGFDGVYAAEGQDVSSGGVISALFGEGGPLSEVLPEGTDIDTMIGTAKEQLSEADKEIAGIVDKVAGAIEEEVGSIDADVLKKYAGELVGQFIGDADLGDLGALGDIGLVEDYFAMYECMNESEEAYIIDHNADLLDQADVQFVANNHIYRDDIDADPIRSMHYMTEFTYRADEENQLWFVSGASDVVLFMHANDLEGGCPVIEASFSEDGENYMPSIEAMCEELGITVEEAMDSIDFAEVMLPYDLEQFLNEHPEYVGIEYDGEIRGAEELDTIFNERLDELAAAEGAETMSEEASAEGTETMSEAASADGTETTGEETATEKAAAQ